MSVQQNAFTSQESDNLPDANKRVASQTVYPVLFAISFCHLLNDTLQAIVPAIYPILKVNLDLTYLQIGLITFVFQMTASVFQPIVGNYTDKKPTPYRSEEHTSELQS